MKRLVFVFFLLALLLFPTSFSIKRLDFREGMFKNVCKDLKNDVLLYLIFVDTRETTPWTEYDIRSTLDSMAVAVDWLHKQARENNITLNIKTDYYIGEQYATINKNLPLGTIVRSCSEPRFRKGIISLNKWSDNIARIAGASFYITDKDGIPEVKQPKNKERLIAHLRDENNVESVALLYMLNNYYKTDISIPINIFSTDNIEYAIVSYKYPSEISHNFLHLFGAADLHKTHYRRSEKRIRFAEQEFPNEIMHDPYAKKIHEMEVSDFTKYLIGWIDTIDENYQFLFYDKMLNL